MVATAPGQPPESGPTRLELLRFSYAEVLDATKHQDDKVGRLLGAVAFLTGGALVFADASVLRVDVAFPDRAYPLGMITLALFLLLDIIAVTSFMIAMSAPLKLPRSSAGPAESSHLYFRVISGMTDAQWRESWSAGGLQRLEDDLVHEIHNIATRADRKYGRTTIATNIFLAALAVLAPTVVVGLAAAGRTEPLPWDTDIRVSVAVSVAAVALSLLLPIAFRSGDRDTIAKSEPVWGVTAVYPLMLAAVVLAGADGDDILTSSWWIVVLGAATILLIWSAFAPLRATMHVLAIAAVGFAGWLASVDDRPDLQLYVAIVGCTMIVVPNIVDELRHNTSARGKNPPPDDPPAGSPS